jgi:hypothetical protein
MSLDDGETGMERMIVPPKTSMWLMVTISFPMKTF